MSKVCLFAQFHPRQRIRSHVVHYVRALQECGFRPIVACSGDRVPPLEDRDLLAATGATLVFRPNQGLDFGAWADLIDQGYADGADTVLLANDSVFGPFRPLQPIIAGMDRRGYDVWGMIESRQHRWHLQSWFLHFTGAAFWRPAIQTVFAQPFASMSKDEIIKRGELALGEAIEKEGLRAGAVVSRRNLTWLARRKHANMMHLDWHHHLVSGRLPFLKADLVRGNGMNIPWAKHWQRVLRERLGVDPAPISDYLYEYAGRRPKPGRSWVPPMGDLKLGVAVFYVLASRDHRLAWRGFLDQLSKEPV